MKKSPINNFLLEKTGLNQEEKRIKKIIKLGGSCLVDSASFKKAVNLIKKEPERVAIVVSALKGVTDLLLDAYYKALSQTRNFQPLIEIIKKRHEQIAVELLPSSLKNELQFRMENIFAKLEQALMTIFRERKTTAELKACVLSAGERLAAYLLANVLEAHGIQTKVYESDQIGLIIDETSNNHEEEGHSIFDKNREIDNVVSNDLDKMVPINLINLGKFDVHFQALAKEINEGEFIPIFTGFFGSNERGETVLIGRGGSDYSAACLARGFKASVLELYKDVPGFLSADPNYIPEPKLIPQISRRVATQLAYFGAKVIYPWTCHPLHGLNTQIVIKSFDQPEIKGTLILAEEKEPQKNQKKSTLKNDGEIKGLALKDNLSVLQVESTEPQKKERLFADLLSFCSAKGIDLLASFSQGETIIFLSPCFWIESAINLFAEARKDLNFSFKIEKDLTLIAMVGENTNFNSTILNRLWKVLNNERINPYLFSYQPGAASILLLVKKDEAQASLKALYREFLA